MKTLNMQCCVPFCNITADAVSLSTGITFHEVPSDSNLRAAWLRALGSQDTPFPDPAVVCSQHFLNDDICDTENGERQIRTGAIPSTVQVCLICFDTQSKLYLMSKYKLDEAYQHLVGHPLHDQKNLKQTLCVQCAQRLLNFSKFRDKSLRARTLMMELVQKHELITMQHLQTMNEVRNELKHNMIKTVLKPDHCDLYIDSSNEETRTTVDSNPTVEAVSVKREEGHIPMSVDDDTPQVVGDNEDDARDFNINLVVTKEEYMSDDEPKQMTDPLLVKPSTSKEQVPEPMTMIKYEVTFECSMCMEEFPDEDAYNYHMTMHMEENQDNQTPAENVSADFGHSSVAPLPWGLVKNFTSKPQNEKTATVSLQQVIKKEKVNDQHVSQPTVSGLDNATYDSNSVPNSATYDSNIECENSLKSILYQNLETSNSLDDKKFTCKFCEYKSKYKLDLVRHERTHTGEKPYACNVCEYKSALKTSLDKHMRTHTGEKPFACELCDYKFSQKASLGKHMRTHTGEKPYACEVCEYKSAQKISLDKHMRTHTGEKPYGCTYCEFKCAIDRSLIEHMRLHTGEEPFACTMCEFKCKTQRNLRRHMVIHSSNKTYSCKRCEFKCDSRKGLIDHMETHAGEKPFACSVCEYRSNRRSCLVRHMKVHRDKL